MFCTDIKFNFAFSGDPNSGNSLGYFFANNLATSNPSFPSYVWKDTTGSKNLILNTVQSPGTQITGDVDDGYFRLSLKSMLLEFNSDTTNKHIRFNSVCYDSVFPGTNGIIGLTQQTGGTLISEYRVDGAKVPANSLLPMWHDANFGVIAPGAGTNRLSYKISGSQLIITYDKVQTYQTPSQWTSYQIVMEIVTGCTQNSNFRFTYSDTSNGRSSINFVNDFLSGYDAAPGTSTAFRNYHAGFSTGMSAGTYGAFVSPANPFPAIPQTPLYIIRSVYNTLNKSALTVEFGPLEGSLNEHDNSTLIISVALQGLQSNMVSPRVRDTVTVSLRESFSPFAMLEKRKIYLDSAFNIPGNYSYGIKSEELSLLKNDISYYITVEHRNSIASWSNPVSVTGDVLQYNFTTSLSNTLGNNSIRVNGAASFYTGDVDTTHDGCVNLTDLVSTYNLSASFVSGSYLISDLNFDGVTNLADVLLIFNNAANFVCTIQP